MKSKPLTNAWMFEKVLVYRGTLLALYVALVAALIDMVVGWL